MAGWGRFPVRKARVARPERWREVVDAVRDAETSAGVLAHGMGRSYGDAALIRDGRVILSRRLDRMLDFDPLTGWLRCEAGVTIEQIIDTFGARGWFPPVVPGTQFVSVGGALACNIHGKNHHTDGCFGDHVRRVELLTGRGDIVTCDADQEPELFWATVGGMGLTGVMLSMEIQLVPIRTTAIDMESIRVENLDEFFDVSAESGAYTHTVSWIDCVKRGAGMGRGIYMRGRHAESADTLQAGPMDRMIELLGRVVDGRRLQSDLWVNGATMRIFNEVFFRKEPRGMRRVLVDYRPFFFPLDVVSNWNYLYGERGFLQYQLVVPSRDAVRACLDEISRSGLASFLAVIKDFGDRDHGGLSFPTAGTTLALDFANVGGDLMKLFDRLDAIVLEDGGRVYLGKDARLPRQAFRQMYPQWERWKAVRDQWDPDGLFRSDLGLRLGLC